MQRDAKNVGLSGILHKEEEYRSTNLQHRVFSSSKSIKSTQTIATEMTKLQTFAAVPSIRTGILFLSNTGISDCGMKSNRWFI